MADKVVDVVLLLAGICGIVYGFTAERFTARSLGWMPGQERRKFTPHWYHRLLMMLLGLGLAIQSLSSLLGIRWRH